MALSLVQEEQDYFAELGAGQGYRQHESQGARGAGPHAPMYDHRSHVSPRPAMSFPTDQVISVLAAIGAVLGARVALLLALGMMFALGFTGERDAPLRMSLFGAFGVIPVALLSSKRYI